MPWTDRQIAEAFVRIYGTATGVSYRIVDWPDDQAENQNSQSVDASAEAPNAKRLAIEVTKIESFPAQRLDDHHTRRLAELLAADAGSSYPPGVMLALKVSAWTPGFDFEAARARLNKFLLGLLPNLKPGRTRHEVPGLPFPVEIQFSPELNIPFGVARIAPPSDTIRESLRSSVARALKHKESALSSLQRDGARTILIMESHDRSIISHQDVYAAFLKVGRSQAAHLEEVWFCATDNEHRLDQWYGLHGPQPLLDLVTPTTLRFGPEHDEEWERAISEGRI